MSDSLDTADFDEMPADDICPSCDCELGTTPGCATCDADWYSWHPSDKDPRKSDEGLAIRAGVVYSGRNGDQDVPVR